MSLCKAVCSLASGLALMVMWGGSAEAGYDHGRFDTSDAVCRHLFLPNDYRIRHEYKRCFLSHDLADPSNYIVEFPGYNYGRSTARDYFIGGTPRRWRAGHAHDRHHHTR